MIVNGRILFVKLWAPAILWPTAQFGTIKASVQYYGHTTEIELSRWEHDSRAISESYPTIEADAFSNMSNADNFEHARINPPLTLKGLAHTDTVVYR